jgi:hypothetical protein
LRSPRKRKRKRKGRAAAAAETVRKHRSRWAVKDSNLQPWD